MSKKPNADLPAFAEHLRPSSGGRGHHSPLFRYLYDRAEAFKRLLEETRPSWDAITDGLMKEGLTNGDGEPLTRRRVQRTWYAVEHSRAVIRQRQQSPPSSRFAAFPPAAASAPQLVEQERLNAFPDAAPTLPSSNQRQAALNKMRARLKPITLPRKETTNDQ